MAISIAFDSAFSPKPGMGMGEAMGTITWDASTLVTGEVLDLSAQFSTIYGIVEIGASTIGKAVYNAKFFGAFATGAAAADGVKAILTRIPELEIDDTVDISAQPLEVADALDAAALGTTRVLVIGKAATS